MQFRSSFTEPALQAWQISESDYPMAGTPEERLRFLLGYAILAPSKHNTQPWRFRIDGDAVDLFADRSRALPVVDPDGRGLVMSCGAALGHLRVAVRYVGYEGIVERFPNANDPDLLARLRLGRGHDPTADDDRLFDAIPRRRSNRHAFDDRPVPTELLDALCALAQREGVTLQVVTSNEGRDDLADLVAEADHRQSADPRFRNELAAWVHPNHAAARDGMRGYGFGIGDLMSHAGPFVIRTFDIGTISAPTGRFLAAGSPALLVLSTLTDTASDWLATGEALSQVLLCARAAGLSSSFLNQPVDVPDMRPRVRDVAGGPAFPQLLVRLGYGPEVKPEPRRPLNEVLIP